MGVAEYMGIFEKILKEYYVLSTIAIKAHVYSTAAGKCQYHFKFQWGAEEQEKRK